MKIKKLKLLSSTILSCIIPLFGVIPVFAENTNGDYELSQTDNVISINDSVVNYQATSDETDSDVQYELDSIIVGLTNKASLELNEYNVDDFNEIDAKSVENLTSFSTNKIKEQRENNFVIDTNNVHYVNESTFNQKLEIELNTIGEHSVSNAIKELQSRDDVLFVQPNYTYKCPQIPNDTCKNEQYSIEKNGFK